MQVLQILKSETYQWLKHKHYAKRLPSISFSYGLYDNDQSLIGVMTIGKPASPSQRDGVCGKNFSSHVFELNRVVINDGIKNGASFLVGHALRHLKTSDLILVSYADTAMKHVGYIYQATNWHYTGLTKDRTDIYTESHSRHYDKNETRRKHRSAKHRYIYFAGNKRGKKLASKHLSYPVMDYPKGESVHYDASYSPTTQMLMSF